MQEKNFFENFWQTRELQDKLTQLNLEGWLENELFTWNWWLLLVFALLPWIIWIKFVDRKSLMEILLFGTFICIPTVFLDVIGYNYKLWDYPITFIPNIPRAIPFDMSMIPVSYMLLYQYFSTWKTYMIFLVVLAGSFAFIGEPFSVWANLTFYFKWHYVFSFLYYILLGITVKIIIEKIKSISKS